MFGTAGADKFAACRWAPAPSGAPMLAGVLTWLDCTIEDVHEAGDHYVVIGRVTTLGDQRDERAAAVPPRRVHGRPSPPSRPRASWTT